MPYTAFVSVSSYTPHPITVCWCVYSAFDRMACRVFLNGWALSIAFYLLYGFVVSLLLSLHERIYERL